MMASLEAPSPNPSSSTITIADSNLNMKVVNPDLKPKKKNQGRIKIPIQKITNKSKKHVTFSKRRKGLIKKAAELCVLCGASVAIITFSEAGKVYSFGHPSTDAVVHRYLGGGASSWTPPAIENPADLRQSWWDRPIEELGFADLQSYAASLEQIRSDVERRITDLDLVYESNSKAAMKMKIDYDYDPVLINQATGMAAIGGSQMSDYFNMNGSGIGDVDPTTNFVSPDYLSMGPNQDRDFQYNNVQNDQYYGYGCMGDESDDINSIVAMASFNRSNRGFGEFGER